MKNSGMFVCERFFKCVFSLYVTFSTELRNYPTLESIHISFYPRLPYLDSPEVSLPETITSLFYLR